MEFRVPSCSDPDGRAYIVDTDIPYCTCPAYSFSGQKRMCKHVTMCRANPDKYERLDPEGVWHAPEALMTGLFTIGHSNHGMAGLLALLVLHQIGVLIDVRSSPYSRFSPHFNRAALRTTLLGAGINYFWAGKELGGLAPVPTDSQVFKGRMAQVLDIGKRQRVALMCSEGPPEKCHRAYKLAAYIHRLEDAPVVTHILRDGTSIDSQAFEASQSESWLHVDFGGDTV